MLDGTGHHEHRALLLMLGVLQRIGQHGGRYDPSTVKRRETERERERERDTCTCNRYAINSMIGGSQLVVLDWFNFDSIVLII